MKKNHMRNAVRMLILGLGVGMLATQAGAAITVSRYEPMEGYPVIVGSTTISQGVGDPGYLCIEASGGSNPGEFGRFYLNDDLCQYWFRASEAPEALPLIDTYNVSYCFAAEELVDGAQVGSDNFVTMFIPGTDGEDDLLVAVLQFDIDAVTYEPRLLAAAIDEENGMTFAEGVAAIQGVPEPSAVLLSVLGGLLLLGKRRR